MAQKAQKMRFEPLTYLNKKVFTIQMPGVGIDYLSIAHTLNTKT